MWNSLRCRSFRPLLIPVIVAAVLYCCWPTIAEAALIGELTQLSGVSGCISEAGGSCTLGRGLNGAGWVAISPDGNHVYVAAFDGSTVAAFSRNASTGVLTQLSGTAGCIAENGDGVSCADGRGLSGAVSLVVSPDGNNVYVASRNNTVAIFSRNTTTGALTQLSGTAGCIAETGDGVSCADGKGLVNPIQLQLSSDGKNVYVASAGSSAVAIFSRNTTTGVLTQLSGTAGCIAENGDGSTCADGKGLGEIVYVTVSPDGNNVYAAAEVSHAVTIFSRDAITGALTQLSGLAGCISEDGTSGTCTDGVALTGAIAVSVSPDGAFVYAAAYISDAITSFSRSTGAVPSLMMLSSSDTAVPTSKVVTAGLSEQVYSTTNSGSGIGGNSGVLIGEASSPPSPSIQSGRIYAEVNGPVNTRVVVANPDDQPVQVSFVLTDRTGNPNYGSASIGSHGQLTAFVDEAPFYA